MGFKRSLVRIQSPRPFPSVVASSTTRPARRHSPEARRSRRCPNRSRVYGLDREAAARSAGQLAQVVARGAAADDLASAALVARLMAMDPVGFADSPWGQMLLG